MSEDARAVSADPSIYTVSQLAARVKGLLEKNLSSVYVEAEISDWALSSAGHAYFKLKDDKTIVCCAMFASYLARCKARDGLKNGAKVLAFGDVSIYTSRGQYQLVVRAVKLTGLGDLMQRYEALKAKLTEEGLFERARKRPLPFLPRRIGLVTSETGAVIHDMCTVLTRRFPNLEIRLYPSLVQGADAPQSLIAGLRYFDALVAATETETAAWAPDLVIIARGGGSIEDLFCFNDEALVRAVAASRAPIISAVGHDTDYTLCDFAADVRAGTPSIAAELAVPCKDDLERRLAKSASAMHAALRSKGEWCAQRLDQLSDALGASLEGAALRAERRLSSAAARLAPSVRVASAHAERHLASVSARLAPAARLALTRAEARLEKAAAKLTLLSPFGVLKRGYSIVTDATGAVVTDASQLAPGAQLKTRFRTGAAISTVETIETSPAAHCPLPIGH